MIKRGLYKLIGKLVVPCEDMGEWARWMGEQQTYPHVADTDVRGLLRVSTAFLGVDHSFGEPNVPPVVFETMIFEVDKNGVGMFNDVSYQTRCSTWEQAEDQHAAGVVYATLLIETTSDLTPAFKSSGTIQ